MATAPAEMKRVLVFGGKTGWIGGLMVDLCAKEGKIRYLGSLLDLTPSTCILITESSLFSY